MSAERANRWAGIVVTVFGFALVGYAIPTQVASKAASGFSPDLWPRMLGWSFVVLGLMLIWQSRAARPVDADAAALAEDAGSAEAATGQVSDLMWEGSLRRDRILPLLVLTAMAFTYAWAIEAIGYYPATATVIPLGMILFGERNPLRLLAVDAGLVFGLYLAFEVGLNLSLR